MKKRNKNYGEYYEVSKSKEEPSTGLGTYYVSMNLHQQEERLKFALRLCRSPPERPKETWLNYVRHVLANSEANNNYKSIPDIMGDVKHLCANRKGWREIVRNMKL